MEIEKKYLVKDMPAQLDSYEVKHIEQGYISTDPVIRIRHTSLSSPDGPAQAGQGASGTAGKVTDRYTLTVKGRGLMMREELNLPLTREAYERLSAKVEGRLIVKDRYLIPLDSASGAGESGESTASSLHGTGRLCELDVFSGHMAPLVLAEVEFPTEEAAENFTPPPWFGQDVTEDPRYQNAVMSKA